MDDLVRLVALEEIKDLKYRYFRAIDTKDRDLLLEVYHEDIEADFRGSASDPATGKSPISGVIAEQILRGAEVVADGAMAIVAPTITVHHGHNPEIHLTSETTAKGIWSMFDLVRNKADVTPKQFVGYGYYHETYEKVNGKWRIKTMKLVRTILDVT